MSDLIESLFEIDDHIARMHGDDRGAFEPVNELRRGVESLTAERDHWKDQHKECTRLLGEALQEATDMAAKRDANAKNATRYRFITANIVDDGDMNVLEEAFGDLAYSDTCTESDFDACIDRAIAKATGEK